MTVNVFDGNYTGVVGNGSVIEYRAVPEGSFLKIKLLMFVLMLSVVLVGCRIANFWTSNHLVGRRKKWLPKIWL